ncbi:hypothetical protein QE372_003626 [Agrobacterium pusense]|nr:hypothetical protein [Agrobacterium pusense]
MSPGRFKKRGSQMAAPLYFSYPDLMQAALRLRWAST